MIQSGMTRGMRVAIVEGDPLLRESLAYFFRAEGCVVELYGSAEDAARIVDAATLDVVISDFHLPGEDGLFVLRRIREERGNAVTVLITATFDADLSARTESAQVDRILLKPYSTAELLEAVRGANVKSGREPEVDSHPATTEKCAEREKSRRYGS